MGSSTVCTVVMRTVARLIFFFSPVAFIPKPKLEGRFDAQIFFFTRTHPLQLGAWSQHSRQHWFYSRSEDYLPRRGSLHGGLFKGPIQRATNSDGTKSVSRQRSTCNGNRLPASTQTTVSQRRSIGITLDCTSSYQHGNTRYHSSS